MQKTIHSTKLASTYRSPNRRESRSGAVIGVVSKFSPRDFNDENEIWTVNKTRTCVWSVVLFPSSLSELCSGPRHQTSPIRRWGEILAP